MTIPTDPDVSKVDWAAFAKALAPVPLITEPALVKQKSRDFYWYSPILKEKLNKTFGDIVAVPRDEADVLHVARTCVKWKVPVTVRGAGTGNYGQAMPLFGGLVLDMTEMNKVLWCRQGVGRFQAGANLKAIDAELRPQGWELRMHPSTKRTATIGGFIAGGSGGVGSIAFGQLRDRGSVLGLRVVTMTDEPEVIELRGDDVQKANHAYGTNGIITELEIPLGPAHDWSDQIVLFDDFGQSIRFAQALGESDGILKKLVTTIAWPIPVWFRQLRDAMPDNKHAVIAMIAEPFREPFRELVKQWGGTISYDKTFAEIEARLTPLYEYSWNHTTLQALKVDKGITYLQSLFPPGQNIELVEQMAAHFGDEVLMHCEFVRWGGRVTNSALQIVRYTTAERLREIIKFHEDHGVRIADPHTYVLEDGGMKVINADQLGFKLRTDPHGLMNPGKMRGWYQRDKLETGHKSLYSGA